MKSVARLYTQFQPKTYTVTFDIDETAMRFSGQVVIEGRKVGRPSQRITLHQHDLVVTRADIVKHDKKGDQNLSVKRINRQNTLQEVRLHTDDMVYAGDYTLTLEFEAPITAGMTGIYPCFFKDGDVEKQIIMTQFESHHAREALPCIDEPEAKAVFNMTLRTRTDITVLGNTPVSTQKTESGQLITTFEPTPKMSSYLLAFVVGEMVSKSTKTARGTDVNVWATVAQPKDSLDFALDTAKHSVEFFEDYFGIPYPLPKLDHVACPDFSSGAMENWGLITYRERTLLAYPGATAQSALEFIALVIAHETSHQWFGNLVTMRWWDNVWLNESFANLMEYQAVDGMFPEWQVWDRFVGVEGLGSLRRDAVAGVQAVQAEVHHPDEISSLFDPSIVYAKGGRVLYMLKNYIGDDAFRAGLKKYFEDNAYSNTIGDNLWAALSEASGKDIAAFMNPWIMRSGFPIVTVEQTGKSATLTQEQFLEDPKKVDSERLWPVPLFASVEGQPDAFNGRVKKLVLKTDETLRIDTNAYGQYLVRYTTEKQRRDVIDLIREQRLSESDRLMLLNGASMQSRAGYEPYGTVLQMLDAYSTESSEPVWDIMAMIIGETRRFVDLDSTLDSQIKLLADTLAAEQLARLGWEPVEGESVADTKLRALVIGLSIYAENEATITKAKGLFTDYKKRPDAISAELRSLIFLVPVKTGDESAFRYLIELHDSTQNSELKGDACDALTDTRDPKQAALLLARLKDSKLVKPQDIDHWLVYLLRNRYTRATAWDWLVANWDWLEEVFKNDKSYDYLPRYAASCVNTREYQQKFRDLFEDKQDQALLKRNIQLGFEEIETRVTWLERDLSSVQQFFA
ncbi:MAG TPA: M1 family metallopeptidase [Verrucomicrobiae bacterium]|nr:M1 family metallopeptidase [Verrucomicrobiae bacterium]